MTELLFLSDSYLRAFDATVVDVSEDGAVVLDQTAFYATSGGQPHDTGTLTDGAATWKVVKVVRQDGVVFHALDNSEVVPSPGAHVVGQIDWERRYRLMRTHTALHVLCGVVFREFGAQVTGGNMDIDKARMDFELDDLNPERVATIESIANQVIQSGRAVSWRSLPRAEAFEIPDLIRTKINLLPADIEQVRIVEIDDHDLQADGGTHVSNTAEVGGIRVIGTRSKGRINKRLEIALVDSAAVSEAST